ncbi:MAG: OpgC domain-containing protein [Hyphomicrobiaceae bacterium]|nr:OpgC domain-containing protein [Hyphomicrobiaceae bacterium]
MLRQVNAVDFWRGYALVAIFINHIPHNFYERFTHKNISLSDSAELFVFLAGWSLRLLVGRPEDPRPTREILYRVLGRAVTLYVCQMAIALIAIAMLAAAALHLENPLFLEWNNAAAVFYDPVRAHIGLILLSHQLGYFDILPLYVVLMTIAPVIALVHRLAPAWLLPISFTIYLVSIVLGLTVPTWPVSGQWFFNPLCWQLIFVLGFSMGRERGPGGWVRRHIGTIRLVAWPVVIVLGIMTARNLWWDPTKVPEPRLLFIIGKTFVTPIRLVQFLALVAVMSAVYVHIARWTPPLVVFFSTLGRNSLPVFCVGSLLSLAGQIIRSAAEGGLVLDTLLVGTGIAILWVVAWLAEWRTRAD